jgi:hypothetical protein
MDPAEAGRLPEPGRERVRAVALAIAAKEAASKAIGTGWSRGVRWRDVVWDADSVRLLGRALEVARRALRPVQKLFWNPNPMIAALSRQSDLNRFHAHLLHNLVLELSRLNLEVQELRNRNLQMAGRLEALARREKTLEGLVVYRDEGGTKDGSA